MLKLTIKETVSCAVQLHVEAAGPPSKEDLQLHQRLLAQIESACHSLHDIFFRLSSADQMNIISVNRAAVREKMIRSSYTSNTSPTEIKKKRLSSATEARLKAKNSPQVESWNNKSSSGQTRSVSGSQAETWNDRRGRVVQEARKLSDKTSSVLNKSTSGQIRSSSGSPKKQINVRKVKPISSTNTNWKHSPSIMTQSYPSPYAKKDKPVWK